ncbi:MAG: hypothetical protein ACE5FU_09815, partial [Nitrospinota bacterium]
ENLERRRYDLGISSLPLSYHFDYLFSNYWISPYGLQYTDGFLFYGRHPFRGRFYNYWHPKRGSSATENSDEFLKKKKDEIKRLKKRRF